MTGGTATIRIEAPNRWDALDLARALPRCEWFLVSGTERDWAVCVRLNPRRLRLIREIVAAAEAWAERREIRSVAHLPDRDVALWGDPAA